MGGPLWVALLPSGRVAAQWGLVGANKAHWVALGRNTEISAIRLESCTIIIQLGSGDVAVSVGHCYRY